MFICLLAISLLATCQAAYLTTTGTSFYYNRQKIFLSGYNIAWYDFGNDFGTSKYFGGSDYKGKLVKYLDQVKNAGGNAVRIWVHCDGRSTPAWGTGGWPYALDRNGNVAIKEMRDFLYQAKIRGVFVIFVLFNGATRMKWETMEMIKSAERTDKYINVALKPLVEGLSDQPALAGYEVMNEPEGSIDPYKDGNHNCYKVRSNIARSGAGFSGYRTEIWNMLRFIGQVADAIHRFDRKAMVTVGSWSELVQTDRFGYKNYYSDACLKYASGKSLAYLNYYQMHTYAHGEPKKWWANAPFNGKHASNYGLSRPLLIGEFSSIGSPKGTSTQSLYVKAYNDGYAGALGWMGRDDNSKDNEPSWKLVKGMQSIARRTDKGRIRVAIK